MGYIHNFIVERGFSSAFATSCINAVYGMLFMMVVIIMHRWYLAIKDMKGIPEEELTEDNKDITISQLMDKYLCKKRIGFLCFISYLVFFAVNYFVITK